MALNEILFFSVFLCFILIMLLLDLGVFNKNSHLISLKEASIWTIVWISLAISFYFFLTQWGALLHGPQNLEDLIALTSKYRQDIQLHNLDFDAAIQLYQNHLGLEFITGYLIEYALSIDNVFVMILIFLAFKVEKIYYHKILFWGILGALIMRFIFIFLSAALIQEFDWILYFFGALLIYTGVKMFLERNKSNDIDTKDHPIVKFASKHFAILADYKGPKFTLIQDGKRYFTPLFLVLMVIEFTDLIFAVDSVPAIFSVTADPYIVFFSNIFAIIGLRSLFFVINSVIDKFRFLKIGLAVLLTFIGIKMIFHDYLQSIGLTTSVSLYIVAGILLTSVLLSVIIPKKMGT